MNPTYFPRFPFYPTTWLTYANARLEDFVAWNDPELFYLLLLLSSLHSVSTIFLIKPSPFLRVVLVMPQFSVVKTQPKWALLKHRDCLAQHLKSKCCLSPTDWSNTVLYLPSLLQLCVLFPFPLWISIILSFCGHTSLCVFVDTADPDPEV